MLENSWRPVPCYCQPYACYATHLHPGSPVRAQHAEAPLLNMTRSKEGADLKFQCNLLGAGSAFLAGA